MGVQHGDNRMIAPRPGAYDNPRPSRGKSQPSMADGERRILSNENGSKSFSWLILELTRSTVQDLEVLQKPAWSRGQVQYIKKSLTLQAGTGELEHD